MPYEAENTFPENIDIQHHDDYIEITRRWLSMSTMIKAIVFIGSGFLLFNNFIIPGQDVALGNSAFLLFFGVLSIGAMYSALAGLLNKSSLFASKESLEVRHKPIPWPGNKRLLVDDVKQLYTKEKRSTGSDRTVTITYQVYVVTKNEKDINLISGLEKREQAEFIEREIEKYLDIKNKNVLGELG